MDTPNGTGTTIDYPLPTRPCVLADVARERDRRAENGDGLLPDHTDEDAFLLLGQDVGRLAFAFDTEPSPDLHIYRTLIRVAATAVTWLERIHDASLPEARR